MEKQYDLFEIGDIVIGRREQQDLGWLRTFNFDLPSFCSFLIEWWFKEGEELFEKGRYGQRDEINTYEVIHRAKRFHLQGQAEFFKEKLKYLHIEENLKQ